MSGMLETVCTYFQNDNYTLDMQGCIYISWKMEISQKQAGILPSFFGGSAPIEALQQGNMWKLTSQTGIFTGSWPQNTSLDM